MDRTGIKYGMLTAEKRVESTRHGQARWVCRCDCGRRVTVIGVNLTSGMTQSCGCLRARRSREVNATHGMSKKTEYTIWLNMRRRCTDPNVKGYKYYGGRGITVCERWNTFENFLADMGRRPSWELTLDRINVNGNYEPGNCRWATWKQQANNKQEHVKKADTA